MTATRAEIFNTWIAADLAWQRELVAVFGEKHAADMRYSRLGQGAPGTNLRTCYDAFDKARTAFVAEQEKAA
jgi:hypothetical protein